MTGASRARASTSIAWTAAKFTFGVGLFAGVVAWVSPEWDDVAGRVQLSLPWLLLSLLGSLLATIVTAGRWKLLSEAMGAQPLRYAIYFHWLAVTRVVGQFMPTIVVDLIGRTAALKAAGSASGAGHLMTSVVTERLFDLLLPLVMLGWAFSVRVDLAPGSPYLSLAAATVAFSLAAIPLLAPTAALTLRVYARIGRWRRGGQTHEDTDLGDAGLAIARPLAAKIIGLSLVRYSGILVQYLGAGAGFGVLLPPLVLLSAAPAAQAAGVLGITPGGLGLQEGGWTAVLASLGQDPASVVVFIAAARLMMLVNFGTLSLLSWPWTRATAGSTQSDPDLAAPSK